MTTRNHCPACGAGNADQAFTVNGFTIERCRDCATLFVSRLPSDDEIRAIYQTDDYYELPRESVERIASENRRRIALLGRLNAGGRLLDIGCARGALLDEAARAGYETHGIEPSARNSDTASARGHRVFQGNLGEFLLARGGETFDVVTSLDVIEHIPDPLAFLRQAVSLLADDGVLVISTPNYSGIIARLLKQRDPFMTPPEHLNFFTARGLAGLADRAGLVVAGKTNFGRLTDAEMHRSLQRYIPAVFAPVYPVIAGAVDLMFALANRTGLGLEQELYLRKSGRAA